MVFFDGVIKLKIKKNKILLILFCFLSTSVFADSAVVSWVGKITPLVAVPKTVSIKGDNLHWKENNTDKSQLIVNSSTFNFVNKDKVMMISLSL